NGRYSIFFFQAEDGIRDGHVTGVQTCALPIFESICSTRIRPIRRWRWRRSTRPAGAGAAKPWAPSATRRAWDTESRFGRIGGRRERESGGEGKRVELGWGRRVKRKEA